MGNKADFSALLQEGCKLTVFSVSHLAEMESEIEILNAYGQFDAEFAKTYLPRFKFKLPTELKAKSIITVAVPRPPKKVIFSWHKKKQSFILPPTYTAYDEKRLRIEALVTEAVGKEGYKIVTSVLPLKLLAVHSGLAEYGKNNIVYVKGMGSFMRLTAFYTDMPCTSDQWQEPKVMDVCSGCLLCQNACPTGAIFSDRFLLHAEKCLTYHNEKDANIPFPGWIKPEWHNCIIGCIRCQAACPENNPYITQVEETVEFTEQETRLMLKGTPCEQMPKETIQKLQQLNLIDYCKELPRNLSALLKIGP